MKEVSGQLSRRSFLGKTVTAGVTAGISGTALSRGRVQGANDRIRVGFIGVGNRGSQLLEVFLGHKDAQVVALCDVYEPYLNRDRSRVSNQWLEELGSRIPAMEEGLGSDVARFKDFRRLLERKDIDAVVIATPDHWHAIQTIAACESGKDVYVEKPLTATVVEGRRMVEVAESAKRVVQVGLQRRSSPVYLPLPGLIGEGRIGKVTVARAYHISNMFPAGIRRKPTSQPPAEFDWDFWLGPRAWRPFQENIHPYRFRWWQDYSSQVGNWGVHYFDAIRWMLGEQAPRYVSAHGGKYAVQDDRTIPDTMEVTFEFSSGCMLVFGQYEAGNGIALPDDDEIELQGTRGTLYSSPAYSRSAGYRIVPGRGGQFEDPKPRMEPLEVRFESGDPTVPHVRDFLDAVRSRGRCRCPLEEGHRSTTFAHLANIAMATRQTIEWDARAERIIGSDEANQLLHYEYRHPWTLS